MKRDGGTADDVTSAIVHVMAIECVRDEEPSATVIPLYGFLWTRLAVAELITQECGGRLGLTSLGALPTRLGRMPQKPVQPPDQRAPKAIERCQRVTVPGIGGIAKKQGGEVFVRAASAVTTDTRHGGTGRADETAREKSQDQLLLLRSMPDLVPCFFPAPSAAYTADYLERRESSPTRL